MARRGFLGGFVRGIERFADRIGNIFAPSEPRREPPPEPTPPPSPPKPPRGRRDPFRQVWRERGGKGDYKKNLDVFHRLTDPVTRGESEEEIVDLWETYVVNINRGEGRWRRQSTFNDFWQESGISPTDFDWKRWRIAMGYVGDRRSRTP